MPYNQGYQQNYQTPQTEEAMDWDGMISGDDAKGFEILPEGDYFFTVRQFTRGRYEGGEKMPPCNKAALTLTLKSAWEPTPEKPSAEGETTVNLFIVKSQKWKLSQFFVSIGYLKAGEEKPMNWSIVPGSSGTCSVTQREWTGNNGQKRVSNDVTRFYDPEESPVKAAQGYHSASSAAAQTPEQQTLPMPKNQQTPWSAGTF